MSSSRTSRGIARRDWSTDPAPPVAHDARNGFVHEVAVFVVRVECAVCSVEAEYFNIDDVVDEPQFDHFAEIVAQVMVATALLTMVVAIMLTRYRIRWR